MTTDDSALPGLGGIYLEDSYVLSITDGPTAFTFELDAVLRPGHPRHHPPQPDEQYCYTRARLVFDNVTQVTWLTRTGTRFTDSTGEPDLGNIDSLTTDGQGRYLAVGDWGQVRIHSRTAPRLVPVPT